MITAISSKVSTSGSSPVISQSTHTIRFESEATNFWQSETADDPFYKKKTKQIWFRKIKNTLVVKTKQIVHYPIFFMGYGVINDIIRNKQFVNWCAVIENPGWGGLTPPFPSVHAWIWFQWKCYLQLLAYLNKIIRYKFVFTFTKQKLLWKNFFKAMKTNSHRNIAEIIFCSFKQILNVKETSRTFQKKNFL